MALVPARCTQCGGQIEVDDTQEAGVCKHCGTAFITEKVINNYTTVHNVTNNVTKIINGKEVDDGEDHYNRAMTHFKLEEYSDARESIEKAIKKNPDNAEFRFAELLIESRNFTDLDYVLDSKLVNNTLKLASQKQKEQWTQEYGYDFTKTKNDFLVDVYKKIIDSCNYDKAYFKIELLEELNKEQISKLFANTKDNIKKYLNGVYKKNIESENWSYPNQQSIEYLLTFAFDNDVFKYKEKCELVSAYIDAYVDLEYKSLHITEENFKLFIKDKKILYVPYQQIRRIDMFGFKKSKIRKGKLPEALFVTPNITNEEECAKYEDKYFDAVVFVDYDDEDKQIIKEICKVNSLYDVSVKSKSGEKKTIAQRTKRFFSNCIAGLQWGFITFLVGLFVLFIVLKLIPIVPDESVTSVTIKWSAILACAVLIYKVFLSDFVDSLVQKKSSRRPKSKTK